MVRLSDGSGFRFLIAIGFNVVVAGAFLFFGASLTTSWFTFLALMGFATLAEIGRQLDDIDSQIRELNRKLDGVLQAK